MPYQVTADVRDDLLGVIREKMAEDGTISPYAEAAEVGASIRLTLANGKQFRLEVVEEKIESNIKVENMPEGYDPTKPLPPGRYEVAVICRGQDNVIINSHISRTPEDVARIAKDRWTDGDLDVLGNEWEEVERYVIRPVPQ